MTNGLRWGLVLAATLLVAVLALRVIARGGHVVGRAAGDLERKL